jgi:hypothetical protein
MLDYAKWLQRALEFMERLRGLPHAVDYSTTSRHEPGTYRIEVSIAPALSEDRIRDLAQSCRLPIPEPLKRFWSEASQHCRCTYWWNAPKEFHHQLDVALPHWGGETISGGPEFSSVDDIVSFPQDCLDWADHFREQSPKDARFWEHSIPFIPVGNGDHIGLYVRDNPDDPPVCYLSHEGCGASCILAPNFDSFLTSWEQVGYLHSDDLWSFVNEKTGFLDPDAFPTEREAIRSLWRGEVCFLPKPELTMTEATWNECGDPETLLDWLERKAMLNERKLRLFNCACCRRVWGQMGEWSRRAVETAERYADGFASAAELEAARAALAGGPELLRALRIECGSADAARLLDAFKRLAQSDPGALMENGPLHDLLQRVRGATQDSLAFAKSQGMMHAAAYGAVDSRRIIGASWEITRHLDEPELTAEKAAHADLVRHIFGNPFHPVEERTPFSSTIRRLAESLYNGTGLASELRQALHDAGHDTLAQHFDRGDHPKGCWALDLILGK